MLLVSAATVLLLALLALLACPAAALVWPAGVLLPNSSSSGPVAALQLFYLNPQNLWENRDLWRQGRKELNSAVRRIERFAWASAADPAVYSVISKAPDMLPPSNDPHDYYSAARYYWPDAAKPPSGLPYARFDGYTNPEIYLHQDPQFLQVVIDDVFNCALAFFYTRNETYAATAARRLQVWFIDPVTAMNPNLNYANWVKGTDPAILRPNASVINVPGSFTLQQATTAGGLLDLGKLYLLIDAIGILRTSTSFTQTHYTGMQTWIAQFYTWTQTSPRALALSKSINNQGTWFDVQQVAMLLFLGRVSEATSVLQTVTVPRMLLQITANGSQPQEQSRTLSWFYSAYNIQGLFVLGFLSQSTPFNLFQYQDAQGRSLVRALDYMLPYATTNGSGWPVANRGNFDPAAVVELCKLAYIVYRDVKYIGVANELQAKPKIWNPVRLWTPYMAFDAPVRSSAARAASHGLWQMVAVGASVVIGAALL